MMVVVLVKSGIGLSKMDGMVTPWLLKQMVPQKSVISAMVMMVVLLVKSGIGLSEGSRKKVLF